MDMFHVVQTMLTTLEKKNGSLHSLELYHYLRAGLPQYDECGCELFRGFFESVLTFLAKAGYIHTYNQGQHFISRKRQKFLKELQAASAEKSEAKAAA